MLVSKLLFLTVENAHKTQIYAVNVKLIIIFLGRHYAQNNVHLVIVIKIINASN